ncbi:MAG: protein phosphatase 2C domain-containing protein [Marinobacter sp.]|uniref:PP2C family protein-serine/threonine phosphatase n=1 Tax=Marinobacter sp. TaxID=50741 RepID=UPI00299D9648|nr:protein phosphatase 2C domain-containing protein [Marinobacter sp.]MDX1756810.1 protein phosphatase 2C domain-containing protein [Marinobacter sp.]
MIAGWSGGQIQGRRKYQEDRYAVVEKQTATVGGDVRRLPTPLTPAKDTLFLLADGMGGMGHGDLAADTVVEHFIASYRQPPPVSTPPAARLARALEAANQGLTQLITREPEKTGMGTTLIALLWHQAEDTIEWLSVGDSLLYLYRDGRLLPLNEKHNGRYLAERYAAAGDAAHADELRMMGNVLFSAVDGRPIREVDRSDHPLPLQDRDLVILASDGLETLPHDELAAALVRSQAALARAGDAEQAGQAIVNCRNHLFERLQEAEAPFQDNCTIVTIGFFEDRA